MLKRILRAALPILLVLLGVGLVAYGVRAHVITVVLTPEKAETPAPSAEKPAAPAEEEPEMPPPPQPPGDPWMSPPRDPWMGGPARDPWMGAPPPDEPSAEEESPSTEEEAPSDESVEKRPAEKKPAAEPAEPTTSQDLEPTLIYDVTIGGVSRSETGQIFRTYVADAGGKPPALCPT